jgi:mandelate racemase
MSAAITAVHASPASTVEEASGNALTIEHIAARTVRAPFVRPVRTAMGEIPAAPLVLIDLQTREGVSGRAYLFAYTDAALKPLGTLVETIGAEIKGRTVAPVARMAEFNRRFRLIGWQGLIGMAVSGIDMALWDALARSRDMPLATMLGGAVAPLAAYDSFGIIDLKADEKALRASVDQGFRAIKIKIGGGALAADTTAVSGVRSVIGPDVKLMVDYNQSLDPVEALRRINALASFDLTWVEEPVEAEDVAGHAQVRAKSPVPIQTGENWWFPRDMQKSIAARASDFAMIDVMKIGGITGWLRAMALAEAASLPVSSHIFVEASAHTMAVTPTAHFVEYLDTASAILREPVLPADGKVVPRGPGLGMDWDEKAVARYAC